MITDTTASADPEIAKLREKAADLLRRRWAPKPPNERYIHACIHHRESFKVCLGAARERRTDGFLAAGWAETTETEMDGEIVNLWLALPRPTTDPDWD